MQIRNILAKNLILFLTEEKKYLMTKLWQKIGGELFL